MSVKTKAREVVPVLVAVAVIALLVAALFAPASLHEKRQEQRCLAAGGEFISLPRDYDGLCVEPGTVIDPTWRL